MVKSLIALLSTTAASVAIAADPTATTASAKEIILNQKTVAELALSQGYQTKQVNLQYQTYRLAVAQVLSTYDWNVAAATGYQYDKSVSLLNIGNAELDNKLQQYQTTISLQKPFTSGTLLGVELSRLSQQADLDPASPFTAPDNQTADLAGITLEQSLWGNFFGNADRATVNAANYNYDAQSILRANDLENVVLDATRDQ